MLSSRLKGGGAAAPAAVLSCGADVGWSGPSVGPATVDLSAVRCAAARGPGGRGRGAFWATVCGLSCGFLRAYAAFSDCAFLRVRKVRPLRPQGMPCY